MTARDDELVFGFPEEWADFRRRQTAFLDCFPNLVHALTLAFRDAEFSRPIDRFAFAFGRVCLEDFFEVLLCCGNGYGHAAQKLVRGLYERAVTLRYLHDNPSELDRFLDFHHVSKRKLMVAIRETMGEDAIPSNLVAGVEERFREVRDSFLITDCKTCGTKRVNHTWSTLEFVSMAKRTGTLGDIIVPGYYIPMQQAHSTVQSLFSRLVASPEGGLLFDPSAQRSEADAALTVAHNILLEVLRVQAERFKWEGLVDQLSVCVRDFMEVHQTDPGPFHQGAVE